LNGKQSPQTGTRIHGCQHDIMHKSQYARSKPRRGYSLMFLFIQQITIAFLMFCLIEPGHHCKKEAKIDNHHSEHDKFHIPCLLRYEIGTFLRYIPLRARDRITGVMFAGLLINSPKSFVKTENSEAKNFYIANHS